MPLPYLADALKKVDPDLYLLSLFAPAERREALWALFLFKYEIAKTRSAVSDTTLGLIRLQWWRDEIGKIYAGGDGGQNPILSTIAPVIREKGLPREHFETLIYAHEFDLEDVAPANLEGLRHYADFTTTPMLVLALLIAGENAEGGDVKEIAIAYGLLQIMRAIPTLLAQRRCYLPQDILISMGLTPQKIIDINHKKEVIEVLKLIQPTAILNQKANSTLLRKFSAFNQIMLNHLRKNGFDVFSAKGQAFPAFLALKLALK